MNELDKRAKMKKKLQMSIPTIDRLGDVILQTEEKLPQMKRVLDQLAPLQDNLAKLESADDIAANLEQSLIDLKSAIDEAIAMGNAANKTNPEVSFEPAELQAMKRHLQDLENMIRQNKGILTERTASYLNPLHNLFSTAQPDWPALEQNIKYAAEFIRNDWPAAKHDLQKTAVLLDTQLPKLERSVHRAALFAKKDMPAMKRSITRTADKIRDFERNNNLRDIIKALKNDAQKESDFLASPITLKEKKIFPIPNYGSAMTPFYTLLALWVGGMLLISSLRVGEVPREGKVSPLSF